MFKIWIDNAEVFLPSVSQDGTNKPTFLTKRIKMHSPFLHSLTLNIKSKMRIFILLC